jgi:hypothetical protein
VDLAIACVWPEQNSPQYILVHGKHIQIHVVDFKKNKKKSQRVDCKSNKPQIVEFKSKKTQIADFNSTNPNI